ncbi:MAG: hydrogenase formation protein HypD [Bryobacterales bacterium]|nr:hydrogenase formation protein HypD [Bryobacterales bacterium]
MKFLDEYRNPGAVRRLAAAIRKLVTRRWTLMEVCGGQTHAIVRFGIDALLPPEVELIHGPGCPVCVTPLASIDKAIAIATRPDVIFASFGDMLRVPGSQRDLLAVKASGGDVRVVYSPMDALAMARANPNRQVVFFAVGFETTAPANAMAAFEARRQRVGNFSLLVSQVLVAPAMRSILVSPGNRVQGFLAAGHVCTVMGLDAYRPLVEEFRVPVVATGFEPVDLLRGIYRCLELLESGRAEIANEYSRSVREEGNAAAQALLAEVFEVSDRAWRGMGDIAASGLRLREPYWDWDAERRFELEHIATSECKDCISGLVLRGERKPESCPEFSLRCTPEHPLGATMVSSEGACSAYYRYRRNGIDA